MGSDRSIANAAWTSSYDKDKRDDRPDEQVERVVKQLATNRHSTPFESVVFRFWFKWPIYVDREHMTHRIASHNGLSARYRTLPTEWYMPPDDVLKIVDKVSGPLNKRSAFEFAYDNLCKQSFEFYNAVLADFKKKEQDGEISNDEYKRVRESVRGVLPIASMVERTTVMNLRSFANYQKVRNSEYAQPEIRYAAQLMLEEVRKANVCPVAIDALAERGWDI